MISVEFLQSVEALATVEQDWRRLREGTETESLSFDEFIGEIENGKNALAPVVLVVRKQAQLRAIVPFTLSTRPRKFTVGEIRLFSLAHRVLHIAGSVIGELDAEAAREAVKKLAQREDCDAVNLYELALASALYQASTAGGLGARLSPGVRDVHPHWLIDFPESFEAYLGQFKSKTRSTLKRKARQFDNAFDVSLKIYREADDVEEFLSIGQKISEQTYQWDLGVRLLNDRGTLERYRLNARRGELRCYAMFADDTPVAFMRGNIVNGIYHYGSPGFLTSYSKWSPGNVMLLRVIEDLIENTDCRRFDFGMGGDFTGYKSMFGNRYYDAASVELYPYRTLKSKLLYHADWSLWGIKRFLRRVISPQAKGRIKKLLRKCGFMK